MVAKLTQEEFISRSTEVHKGKYDYSKTVYVRGSDKVIITCPVHGDFRQRGSDHLKGAGCKRCALEYVASLTRLTNEQFIERSKEMFGDAYDYSKCKYTLNTEKVTLFCHTHQRWFEVIAANHLSGQGCQKCGFEIIGNKSRLTNEQYIEKALSVHGSKYSYTKTKYSGRHEKILVTCNIHNLDFLVNPKDHLRGRMCPQCSKESYYETRSLSQDEFLARAIAKHGIKYDYSCAKYTGINNKVKILCKEHNRYFEMQAANHLQGQGCPRCAQYGFRREKPSCLYIHKIAKGNVSFTGYGITSSLSHRTKQHNLSLSKSGFRIVETEVLEYSGEIILQLETALKQQLASSSLANNICGFKRESTDQSFQNVVTMAKELFKEMKWQHLTLPMQLTE